MSNKEQLQINNTQLAALIQTLQSKVTGGGLPDGLLAIDMGSVTLASAKTYKISNISHGLGVVPDFIMFVYDPDTKFAQAASCTYAYFGWKGHIYNNSYNGYLDAWHDVALGLNSSYINQGIISYNSSFSNLTDTTFNVATNNASYKFPVGTYLWVAGVFK